MRTRLSAQLLLVIVLFYLNYFFYFHRWTFLRRNNSSEGEIVKSIQTRRYGEEFCVAFNVTLGTEGFREDGFEPVTLAVHATPGYLNHVFRQVSEWDGPISLALFIDRASQISVDFLHNIHICDKEFAKKISLHVVFKLPPFVSGCPVIDISTLPCANITYKYNDLLVSLDQSATKVCRSNFALSAKKLANENLCEDCRNLIVIRRFELEEKIKKVPRNISDLKAQIDSKKLVLEEDSSLFSAFEFHHKHFPAGHTIEGLWNWFKVSSNSSNPFLWQLPYKSPAWEPQVITHSSAPLAWEKVPTRLRDQQAAIYELCRAEYNFLLASHLFNVHKGVKRESTHLDAAIRTNQLKLKAKYLPQFKSRMDQLYPNTTSKCGKFTM